MATATSGYPSRDAGPGLLHHGGNSGSTTTGTGAAASTCSSTALGFAMANGSEDHCNVALAGLFQQIMNDMKGSTFVWEDFLTKSGRLHTALKSTLVASSAFLDAFQRVADVATNARGGTKEIGKCLTRMVLRQRSIEAKMKTFTSALMDCLVTPLQEKMEDWKKTCLYMDKEHAKEYKKWRQEIKKRSTDTIRLQKKAKKGNGSSKAMEAWNDLVEMKRQLQEKEFEAVRQAMIEERSRLCLFVSCLKPFLDEELSMLSEMVHLEEITDSLMQHSADPFQLPPASLQAILDVKATCSSTVSTTDILLQDHLANETYYSSSCSSGSNQWGNYMSPPNSPLPEEPVSSRSSNQDDGISFREAASTHHADAYSSLSGRHGSICSISNASTSSYASSDVSLSSYGGINLQDKTLCPAPSAAKAYRRCFSDNNGHEQHYYPSSIASSIVENDNDVELGTGEGKGGMGAGVEVNGQRRGTRQRRSSVSRSEDLHPDNRLHPLSLAVRNEYYSSIRFSSISSGDSGFISHPDQNHGNHADGSQDAQDSLLTPTMQNGCGKGGDKSTWSSPTSISSSDSDNAAGLRRPPVPPFGSVLREHRMDAVDAGRPHTIAYNGGMNLMGSRGEDAASCRQVARNHKRPPLTQETFVPPPPVPTAGFPSMAQIVLPKEFRRSCNLDNHPQLKDDTVVYANSDLLNDTSCLPPPPDCWIGQNDLKPGDLSVGDKRLDDAQQVTVSMTIRRVKDKAEYFGEGPQAEVMRKQMIQERQLRRHSQQIYGVPQSFNRPPPPPLPIRRTPSLHQSICDTDADVPLHGPVYSTPPVKSLDQSRPKPTDNHATMINALQERLRQGAKAPVKQQPPNGAVPHSNGAVVRTTNGPASVVAPVAGGPPRAAVAVHAGGDGGRNGLFEQIRNGAFYLRKVNPDQCRDRSSPFIRK
ncbi:uncharacterized protein LOC129591906 isoform X2 [Paramacrobiotus metropolitanus]|uniref:uncharacterized protein LOC129591906 isoform X2 n=1 Tax=Paramacrobiotus metropolitanus TaxID=2943436 RepID=UPI00244587D5|nr:uncharacterized protein LOC129591906 isoform X2 [Paramacrobiotus metropolitanus]